MTHYIRMVRGILLRGSAFTDHLPEAGAMLLFLVVTLAIATKLFRKEMG